MTDDELKAMKPKAASVLATPSNVFDSLHREQARNVLTLAAEVERLREKLERCELWSGPHSAAQGAGMKLSEAQRRGLQIIRDNRGIKPARFAKLMWPDSEAWQNVVKCGHGSHRGGGMYLAAGGFMGKLRKMKLTTSLGTITEAGRAALKEARHD